MGYAADERSDRVSGYDDGGGSVMSAKFKTVKYYYDSGLWNKTKVRNAVTKGWITEEEYALIVGEEA